MAKITVDIGVLQNKVAALEKLLNADVLKDKIGVTALRYIVVRTKFGRDIARNGFQKPLAESTIQKRLYLEKYNATDPAYKAERSNLTFSGQFLKAVVYQKIYGGVRIFFDNQTREPYRGKSGKPLSKRKLSNAQLAVFLNKKGRKALGIDSLLRQQIKSVVSGFIKRLITQLS